MRDINSDLLMDKMSSNSLLTPHDQELILIGHSMYQRNWLLLEHVRRLEMEDLVKVCELIQEISPEISLQLLEGMCVIITDVAIDTNKLQLKYRLCVQAKNMHVCVTCNLHMSVCAVKMCNS